MLCRVQRGALLVLVFGSSGEFSCIQAQIDTSDLKQRFLTEAPAAWEAYGKWAKGLQGKITLTSSETSPKPMVHSKQEFEVEQSWNRSLFLKRTLIRDGRPDGSETVAVVNPRYGFVLDRRSPSDPWTVSELHADEGRPWKLSDPPEELTRLWTNYGYSFALMASTLRVVVDDPGFEIRGVSGVEQGGRNHVRVDFAYRNPPDNARVPRIDGWVSYDPMRSWMIAAFDVELEWTIGGESLRVESKASYEYADGDEGYPIPTVFE